jgi:ubiquinone/menaquinone biosynthesis C-methylase UbiE
MNLPLPTLDPSPIFELFRGSYATELLTAAVAHFNLFDRLAKQSLATDALATQLGLATRPAIVLTTALKSFGLLAENAAGRLTVTDLARQHLLPGCPLDIGDYIGLAAQSPGVLEMVERLKTNRPAGTKEQEPGVAFMYREGVASAMEEEASARHFTLALAGRAKNVAPVLAERVDCGQNKMLVDVGGGSGVYSVAFLLKNSTLRAVVVDRPEVLKVAKEMADAYGVAERLTLHQTDMFRDPLPAAADVVLLSNVLHDWDVPECRALLRRCVDILKPGGRLLIHDVFLNDALDGPLPIALYSAALFCLTEGRAYSAAEYRGWLQETGLTCSAAITPTLIHCGVLEGAKK